MKPSRTSLIVFVAGTILFILGAAFVAAGICFWSASTELSQELQQRVQ